MPKCNGPRWYYFTITVFGREIANIDTWYIPTDPRHWPSLHHCHRGLRFVPTKNKTDEGFKTEWLVQTSPQISPKLLSSSGSEGTFCDHGSSAHHHVCPGGLMRALDVVWTFALHPIDPEDAGSEDWYRGNHQYQTCSWIGWDFCLGSR